MFRSQLQTWVYFTPKHSSRSLTRVQYLRFFYFRQNVLNNKMSWSSVNHSLSFGNAYTRVTHILSKTENWPSLQKVPLCPFSVNPPTCSDYFSPQMTFVYFTTLYKWNHTVRVFLCLASFWQHLTRGRGVSLCVDAGIALHGYTGVGLSLLLLIDTWAVGRFWLRWMKVSWILVLVFLETIYYFYL